MEYDKIREIINYQIWRCVSYGPWHEEGIEQACNTATAAIMEPLWRYLQPDPDFGVCVG